MIHPNGNFPKVEVSNRENNIIVQLVEFEEETDLTKDEYTLLENVTPVFE